MKWVVMIGALLLSTQAFAYTEDQARLCTGDAMRLCASAIPDVGKVTICMRKQKVNLSAGCKSVFDQAATNQPTTTPTRQN